MGKTWRRLMQELKPCGSCGKERFLTPRKGSGRNLSKRKKKHKITR